MGVALPVWVEDDVFSFGRSKGGRMQKSAEIFLEPGTRVPDWLAKQARYVHRARANVNGRRAVPVLTLLGGSEARFFPGGQVGVKTPAMPTFRGAFEESAVLGIANLMSGVMQWNDHYCEQCSELAGVESARRSNPVLRGKSDVDFTCRNCGHEYTRTGI